ncbi:hypothetical protein NUW54_g11924 [Trametes sanguinea]|uniref:Uncharacterized protein n=1 Tax=Trametes sanguinea TaxID=158606 RepID=A0ACC1N588_9APHY|nr:hypothetical protein NUW54_g11924 [Trametes sanguinea]
MPIPEPMHMLVQKIFEPVCFAMFSPVATWRAPAAQPTSQHAVPTYQGEKGGRTASQRVADGDRAAVQVDLLERDAEGLYRVHRLARERLVDLVKVHLVLAQPGELEHLRDRVRGADAHDPRGHADGRRGDELADDGEAELLRRRAAREEDGCSAVGHLRGVS